MRILIIGFGSIGQRHYQNLKKIGFRNVWVFDVDQNKVKSQKLKVKIIDEKSLKCFNVVFVCVPNYLHLKYALLAAKAGCHLFIEKPLSHNLAGVSKLIKTCQKNKLITMVGCNLRFNPAIQFIKKYLASSKLGRVYAIHHEFGYYLPYWRPKQDYRKNYAAKRAWGGGIILDDIHEFDLLFWLNNFSEVKKAKFIYDKISNLQIETEDICIASFQFKNGVISSVRCDYLQQVPSRNLKVISEKGNLEFDFNLGEVWLKNKKNQRLFSLKRKNDNPDYISEIKYFLACVKNKKQTFNNLNFAAKTLAICLKR
ncbi:MAG: hypothetical protein A2729_04145 [Candidatus Buchananbacteria bacterium RIFCSPHIGHO2_01_FULL_39_14]|uniref:Gfo/Idh/MocA-like oxidoreductase N-terminal domain-containing protein n=1 Tax=Candidatus Buchananbacteria bacterium RIFCSPHIGHO2_01_FULL_39_14 TaxID=1797532 RepID=A0A1G1XYC9_9BACT|nr:MAG: hypothetical protein A2729_04145 [Candidatus Buchananbacteria bacterium RIFCSPHIGHO2_01_FULL_39_14]